MIELKDFLNKTTLIDVIDGLDLLPDNCVHTCVTSPPYWALRDYKIEPTKFPEVTFSLFGMPITIPAMTCQLGLEKTPMEFIGHIVFIFRKVNRVLRKDGTLWLNMGDCYNSKSGGYRDADQRGKHAYVSRNTAKEILKINHNISGMKKKDMVGIPWMMAFALREDGWYLRQDIIWHKSNPMPESVNDRCTKAHEYIFLFSKSARYYYDAYAISTEITDSSVKRYMQNIAEQKGSEKSFGGKRHNGNFKAEQPKYSKPIPHSWGNSEKFDGRDPRDQRETKEVKARRNEEDNYAINGKGMQGHSGYFDADGELIGNGRANKKSVWTMYKSQTVENHYAAYPIELPTICIKAGTSEHGVCSACGNPYIRKTDKVLVPGPKAAKNFIIDERDLKADENDQGSNRQKEGHKNGHHYEHSNIRWEASCKCNAPIERPIVLEPFSGTKTTGIAAKELNCHHISFEVNPEYKQIGDRRSYNKLGLFN